MSFRHTYIQTVDACGCSVVKRSFHMPGELPRLVVLALLLLSSSHVLQVKESRLCGVPADDRLSWRVHRGVSHHVIHAHGWCTVNVLTMPVS